MPIVAIAGRRNVGKSTLFNALVREKRAIVDAVPGLTRDVISCTADAGGVLFTLADTPGLDLPGASELSAPILENARAHLARAAVIVLLMEPPAPESYDHDLAALVRKLGVPCIAVVNKIDSSREMEHVSNFYELGFAEIVPLSAKNRMNTGLLMEKIAGLLPVKKTAVREPDMKLALVGKPNSGKSTLMNSLLGYSRSVVSDLPGTTRDAVDEEFTFHGRNISIIDTAGMRKKSRIQENIEYYSLTRTLDSIRKADVTIHLVDATAGLTDTDKKISDEILAIGRPVIIAVNKWDAIEKDHKTFDEFRDKIERSFYRARDFPIISISAKNRQRTHRLIEAALDLYERARTRIDTPRLNRVLATLQGSGRVPQMGDIRIYYATQIPAAVPVFKLFVNKPDLFRKDVLRYFEKSLQKELGLEGVPVLLQVEGKKKK